MWKKYQVDLQMTGRFAAALPKTEKEIKAMLENRMPTNPPPDYMPIEQLVGQVLKAVVPATADRNTEVDTEEAEMQFGWATFPHDEKGNLYYEGRCIRGHLKDCANQIKDILKPPMKALKAKVANKVYVMTDIIPLYTHFPTQAQKPDGTETRFVHVMTMQGERSTIKYLDYLEKPVLSFVLNVLEDGIITEDILRAIFDYGSVHGLGQDRSTGWGRYTYKITLLAQ